MIWHSFHHPDISWPVIKRRASTELMELLELTALFLCKGGWGVINRSCYPSQTAYYAAKSRLQKQGLIIQQVGGAQAPRLTISDAGSVRMPSYFKPEAFWNRSWQKIWYMMVYDVPEKDRKYRNVLRQFLKRKRMGCLQKSVWITPEDIRPDFSDLSKAAAIEAYAFLFESRTVLRLPTDRIVESAWKFDRLNDLHEHYCTIGHANIAKLQTRQFSAAELAQLTNVVLNGYHGAMQEDPLLPSELLPKRYLGKKVYSLHRELILTIDRQLQTLHPN